MSESPASPNTMNMLFSKVAPDPTCDGKQHTCTCSGQTVSQRCPVELFRARRGYEQCKLNFLTSVVESYDKEYRRASCPQQSGDALIDETNNSNGNRKGNDDKELSNTSSVINICSKSRHSERLYSHLWDRFVIYPVSAGK